MEQFCLLGGGCGATAGLMLEMKEQLFGKTSKGRETLGHRTAFIVRIVTKCMRVNTLFQS